jgi:hypothetical protein
MSVHHALSAAPAIADPGSNNPQAQYRAFYDDHGNTYMGVYVGVAPANFLLVGTTNVFATKTFTEYAYPGGPVIATYNTGINGFDPSTLITCHYTDPAGIYNVFTGFITPRGWGLQSRKLTTRWGGSVPTGHAARLIWRASV